MLHKTCILRVLFLFNTSEKGKFVEFDNNSGKVDYVLYIIFGLNLRNTFTGEYLSYAYLIQSDEHKRREDKKKWVADEFNHNNIIVPSFFLFSTLLVL